MSQSVRTLVFLGVAAVCVGIGFATHSMYKPSDLEAFVDVGEPFYPKFDDPNNASGLRVASFNDDTGKTDVFSVENKNGIWQIPSHHNYPADGEELLAQTAASMVGVKRQALIEKTKAAHKRYDLLDPLDDEVTGSEGRGDRITLYEGDEPLVDFIVGKKVDGQENVYYVRAANEDRFYTADLGEFSISTKFTDWINKDILDIERSAVRKMIVNRYKIDETPRGLNFIPGDPMVLDREGSSEPWKLEGLDESKEELQTSDVTALLTALDDLSIVGVRNKPAGISAGLKGDSEDGIAASRSDILDLQDKGFFIDRSRGEIVSNEGEVMVGTEDGVMYVLGFGEEFSGSEVDIEVGSDSKNDEKSKDDKKAEENESDSDESDDEDSLAQSRYLFVRAAFDQSLLGEKPTPPVKPEPPQETEATEEAAKEEESAEEKSEEAAEAENADSAEAKPDPKKEYEEALQKYEEEQEVYEIKLKNYNEKITKGKERVDELNRRFADWYYVISAEVFDRMKINRDELVKEKEEPAEEEGASEAASSDQPAVPSEKPEMKTPAAVDKPAETEKPAEKEKAEEAAAEKKDDEKPESQKTSEVEKKSTPDDERKPAEEKPEEKKKSDASDDQPAEEKPETAKSEKESAPEPVEKPATDTESTENEESSSDE